MSGIFPEAGCSASNAVNTLPEPLLEEGCVARYHCPRCTPKFDPASANAVISEILNAMECSGIPYDCTALDNLCKAMTIHEISGRRTFEYDEPTPVPILAGSNRRLGGGEFTVPNTFHRTVNVAVMMESTVQFEQIAGGADATLDIDIEINSSPAFDAQTYALLIQRIRNFEGGTMQFASNPTSYRGGIAIPPGGKTFYWRARSTVSGGANWQLQYTQHAVSVTIYGTSAHQRDIFT